MDEAQQQAHPELQPKLGTRSTHGVYLWNWKTQVTLSRNQNGEETEVQRDAQVRIWDFGGQETYHGTHRVFAASGALYILVVNDRPGDLVHQDSRLEEWVQEKINHQRPLQYWLDYIVDLNRMHRRDSAKAKVLLVRSNKTHRGEGERPWVELLAQDKENSRHAARLKVVEQEYFVGSLKGEWSRTQFETPFFPDLKKYLGKQVLEEGIRVPRLFARVMQELRGWVEEITSLSHERSILTWHHWVEIVRGWALEEKVEGEPLPEWEVEALTAMLHEGGDLFWMRGEGGGWILVQQVLALKEIYRLAV